MNDPKQYNNRLAAKSFEFIEMLLGKKIESALKEERKFEIKFKKPSKRSNIMCKKRRNHNARTCIHRFDCECALLSYDLYHFNKTTIDQLFVATLEVDNFHFLKVIFTC